MNSFSVEKAIEIDVSLETAYEQWCRLEFFLELMRDSNFRITRDETRLRQVQIAVEHGQRTPIVQPAPNKRITWRTRGQRPGSGTVTFYRRSASRVGVRLRMAYEADGVKTYPIGFIETAAHEVERILDEFKSSLSAVSHTTTVKTTDNREHAKKSLRKR